MVAVILVIPETSTGCTTPSLSTGGWLVLDDEGGDGQRELHVGAQGSHDGAWGSAQLEQLAW
jgi:hypothetical protein